MRVREVICSREFGVGPKTSKNISGRNRRLRLSTFRASTIFWVSTNHWKFSSDKNRRHFIFTQEKISPALKKSFFKSLVCLKLLNDRLVIEETEAALPRKKFKQKLNRKKGFRHLWGEILGFRFSGTVCLWTEKTWVLILQAKVIFFHEICLLSANSEK